ncbi:MAG TPA: proline iminopeptidase-family hydrolase [Candidatus Limnocylindrales bacterium]|nr:proline iminopeptidase-family hydrolase [Candidatus Limnocylindrales bacterium]
MVQARDGYIPFMGFKTYYKIVGKPRKNKLPLLVLHGGPGGAHNYLLGLQALSNKRQVIFYDQLGCGLSDHPEDNSLWTIQLFIDELKTVRKELGLNTIHLLGHSWGGMLAIDYLLTQPEGVHSAVLASTMISMPLYQEEVDKLKQALPANVYAALTKHEKAGTTDASLYKWAYNEYQKQHLFRGGEFPPELSIPQESVGDASYKKMWGASEAYADGTMKNWDRIKKLHEITIPTLITSGQYDELTPWQASITRDNIPNSQLKIFTNGSHLVHIEQPEEYVHELEKFIEGTEAGIQ